MLIRKFLPTERFSIYLFHDPVFHPLKNILNSMFKQLHNKWIGTDIKATQVLSLSEEDVRTLEGRSFYF